MAEDEAPRATEDASPQEIKSAATPLQPAGWATALQKKQDLADYFPFDKLPAELRNRIYELLGYSGKVVYIDCHDCWFEEGRQLNDCDLSGLEDFGFEGDHLYEDDVSKHKAYIYDDDGLPLFMVPDKREGIEIITSPFPKLAQVSKKVRAEVLSLYYSSNKFEIRCHCGLEIQSGWFDSIGEFGQHLRRMDVYCNPNVIQLRTEDDDEGHSEIHVRIFDGDWWAWREVVQTKIITCNKGKRLSDYDEDVPKERKLNGRSLISVVKSYLDHGVGV